MKVIAFIVFACILLQLVSGGSQTLAVNQIPEWDLCVNGGDIFSCSGHGGCSGGKCVCTDGYTGRDCSIPPGGFPYVGTQKASVTQFCQLETGGCAPGMCVGGGQLDHNNLPPGIDGVAAVNPTLYGSRYAYTNRQGAGSDRTLSGLYSFVGQSCGTCWKLTKGSVSIVVSVVDRCAGYCRATVAANPNDQQCSMSSMQGGKECGECIQIGQPSVPQCSCLSPNSTQHNGWCNGYQTAHCDWCAANDHPHFDLDVTAQTKICGNDAGNGFCQLDSFQMVACPDLLGAWPNGYPNGTGAPTGVNTVKPVDTSANQKCYFTTGNGQCKSINEEQYVCNGRNLTMCHYGKLMNLGCPLGTVCSGAACIIGNAAQADPVVATCTPTGTTVPITITQTTAPTTKPTTAPTMAPTAAPTAKPTTAPTMAPTAKPTAAPTMAPTARPPVAPTTKPTNAPTVAPTTAPTAPTQSVKMNIVGSIGEWWFATQISGHRATEITKVEIKDSGSITQLTTMSIGWGDVWTYSPSARLVLPITVKASLPSGSSISFTVNSFSSTVIDSGAVFP